MAKKSRRARLSPTQRYMPTPGAAAPPSEAAAPVVARPAARPQAVSRLGEKPEDYAHMRADLQRMAILAGSILAVLVALRVFIFR